MMKKIKIALAVLSMAFTAQGWGQAIGYTPTPYAAYISPSAGVWNAWTSAAAFGQISFVPPAIGLYCQASAGAQWTPCVPGGGGGSGTVGSGTAGQIATYPSSGTAVSGTNTITQPITFTQPITVPSCTGCGGGGGTPGGSSYSLQYNNASAFGGASFNGVPLISTTAAPVAATPTQLENASSQYVGTCLGQFDFTDVSPATAMVDTCNGYVGSIGTGSGAPTRTGQAYVVAPGNSIQFPSQENAFTSMIMAVNLLPLYAGTNTIQTTSNAVLLGANSSATNPYPALNLIIQSVTNSPGTYTMETQYETTSSGVFNSSGVFAYAGVHILGITCTSFVAGSQVKFYLDGNLYYTGTSGYGCTQGPLTTGNLQIGGSTSSYVTSNPFTGPIYAARFGNDSGGWSDAVMAQNSAVMKSVIQARGVQLNNPTTINQAPQYLAVGDSITCGANITTGSPQCGAGTVSQYAYPNVLSGLKNTYNVTDWGVPGTGLRLWTQNCPVTVGPYIAQTLLGQSIVSLFAGTNSFFLPEANPIGTWQLAQGFANCVKNLSPSTRLMYIDMISRGGNGSPCPSGSATYDTCKNLLNAQVRAGWQTSKFDVNIDLGADPLLGADGANANATYFTNDNVHPTIAGQAEIALAVSCGINWLDQSTPASPTTITAATYTTGCGDGAVTANAASNNIVITLDSALWQTGRSVPFCNNTITGTNTVTLTAPSDFPFNNISGLTTYVVPNKSCVSVTSTFNGVTATPGDYWQISTGAALGTMATQNASAVAITGGTIANATISGTTVIPVANGGTGVTTLTTGQAVIGAGTAAVTGKALAGAGAGLTTGPTTSVSTDLADFTGTAGQVADSGLLLANVPSKATANTFTAAQTATQFIYTGNGTATASPGTGVTSVTCATATCTNTRGTFTIVGGTATTGTIATISWTATSAAWACQVMQNGGTSMFAIGHSVATTTGFTVSAGLTVAGATFSVDYECQP